RGKQAMLSQHIGDLDNADAFAFFEETVGRLAALAGRTPEIVAHDLHSDYRSTRWARASRLPCIAVQHHHAHIASCLVENGHTGPVLGVAFDGTGMGMDGTLWGGEVLIADLGSIHRVAHLRSLPLLGGEAAIRAPWRIGAAALLDAGESLDLFGDIALERRHALEQLWARPHLSPRATGAGRWFDAVAALCGLRHEISYDGQAAMEREAAAAAGRDHAPYGFGLSSQVYEPLAIDLRPAVRAIAADLHAKVGVPIVAARFHRTLANAIGLVCSTAREAGAPST